MASSIGVIPVLSVETNVGIEGQTSFVGTSNVDAAKQGGLWAAEQAARAPSRPSFIYGQEGDNNLQYAP
jgi:ribose transport system substrate-binding protein